MKLKNFTAFTRVVVFVIALNCAGHAIASVWGMMAPGDSTKWATYASISGNGSGTLGQTRVYLVRRIVDEVAEKSMNVTPTNMPGLGGWWGGVLQSPTGGWTPGNDEAAISTTGSRNDDLVHHIIEIVP